MIINKLCSAFFLGIISFGIALLLPTTAFATQVDVSSYEDGVRPNSYVVTDQALLHIKRVDDLIKGRAWSKGGWSDWEDIVVINADDVVGGFWTTTFVDGTVVMGFQTQDYNFTNIMTYTRDHGFQHQGQQLDDFLVTDVMPYPRRNAVTLTQCVGEGPISALSWSLAAGFGEVTELNGSFCGEDLEYLIEQKQVIIDYYTGTVYDRLHNYAIVATTNFSKLDYADADDLYDSQGDNPQVFVRKNGDLALTFRRFLYGYSYQDEVWTQRLKLPKGFQLVSDGHSDYSTAQSSSNERTHVVAFAVNKDQTEYQLYRWTSKHGWQLEQSYEFDQLTRLIVPESVKRKDSVYWAFWTAAEDQLSVYRWTKARGYKKMVSRAFELDCEDCGWSSSIILDQIVLSVSKKNKVFIAWYPSTALYATAWDPDTAIWQDQQLGDDTDQADFTNAYITDKGQWIVEFKKGDQGAVVRWTPDQGWGSARSANVDNSYFHDNKYYFAKLASDGVLQVKRMKWKTGAVRIKKIEGVSEFPNDRSFIYQNRLFLYYLIAGDQSALTATKL